MPLHSSLARLQQILVIGTWAGAVMWLLNLWPQNRWLALVGSAAVLTGPYGVLGVEFLLLCWLRRTDPAPQASAATLLRAWWAECQVATRVFAWRQPFRWRCEPDHWPADAMAGRYGVVFVHGFLCNRGFWTPWRQRLRQSGRAHVSLNLEPVFGSIDAYAPQLEAAVAQVRQATGLPPVLVCHSMGGLIARAWLKTQPADRMAHVVTIASPHAGTWLAAFSQAPSAKQMRMDSRWLQDLQLAMTPQLATRFTCWWSNCDNIVVPPSAATLPGADNRFVPGAAHVDLAFHDRVIDGTLALIDGLQVTANSGS